MKSIFANWKTSICGLLSVVAGVLVSVGTLNPVTGAVAIGLINGVGHILGADGSTTTPLVASAQAVANQIPDILTTVKAVQDNHTSVAAKIDDVAGQLTKLTDAIAGQITK